MFETGIYKRSDLDSDTRVLLFKKCEGFILNSNSFTQGTYGDDWVDEFNIIDRDYKLSKEDIEAILNNSKYISKQVEDFLFYYNNIFNVTDKFLISENKEEIFKINILDKILKINDNLISIEYSGKIVKIRCNQFDELRTCIHEYFGGILMFKTAIYKRNDRDCNSRVLLFKESQGFILNSNNYAHGRYGKDWVDEFNIIDKEFILSDVDIKAIRKNPNNVSDNVEEFFLNHSTKFNVINSFLVSELKNDFIKIDILDRISKIDENTISIVYSGKSEKIRCSEFDKLQKVFINIKEVF